MASGRGCSLLLLAALPLLFSCATLDTPPCSALKKYSIAMPHPRSFTVCTSFGCRDTRQAFLTSQEWVKMRELFSPSAATPEQERGHVALAIGLFEELVGPKVGTERDAPGNGWQEEWSAQLDCIAEAVNSTVYLLLLEQAGLLHHHRVAHPARRRTALLFPHRTAVIVEHATASAYAVDSWFHANGVPAEIVPLQEWRKGYRP
jgi:hypothetical protein